MTKDMYNIQSHSNGKRDCRQQSTDNSSTKYCTQ